MNEGGKAKDVKDVIDAATELCKAVPIYQDAVQGIAKEGGKALTTLGKTINVALAPLSVLIWGYERIADWLQESLSKKMEKTPPEQITTPDPAVAGPVVESLRFKAGDPDLREMYSNLLATAMDSKLAHSAHPAFVEILKQISPDEARLLKVLAQDRPFPVINIVRKEKSNNSSITIHRYLSLLGIEAGCRLPQQTPIYLDNLCRLGIIDIPAYGSYVDKSIYANLERHPEVKQACDTIGNSETHEFKIRQGMASVTSLGRQFIDSCVDNYESRPR